MKILQLRLNNLNSLVGQWHIDLTDPAFISDGIFAITGATGAGKSTILDAICLGLYGRTPRLAKISASTNEIMARGTGECWAEVTFATPAGAYRSHWSQRRARGAVDGQLQPPQHEVSEVSTQKILAAKLKDTEQLIWKLTGMEYDQFTRSMLLAQGHFAAFLRAKPRERTPILEQITGTHLYSEISIAAHERCVHEKTQLDHHQSQLEQSAPLLSEQELSELQQRLETITTDIKQVQTLEKGLGELVELQQRTEDTEQAHAQLKESIQHHQRDLDQWQSTELTEASAALKDAAASMEAAERSLQDGQATYQAVRELHTKIHAGKAAIRELNADRAARQSAQAQHRKDLAALKNTLATTQADLNTAAQALQTSAGDAELAHDYSGLLVELQNLGHARAAAAHSHNTWQAGLDELQDHHMKVTQLRQDIAPLATEQEQVKELIQTTVKERQELLAGHKMSELRTQIHQLRQQLELASRWLTQLGELDQIAREQNHTREQIQKGAATLDHLTQQLDKLHAKQQDTQAKLRAVDEASQHHNQVLSFAEHRKRLQPEKPCPLCGAKDHPFVKDEPSADHQLHRQRYEQQLASITAELNAQQLDVASQQARGEELERRSIQLEQTHTELTAQLAVLISQLTESRATEHSKPQQLQQQLQSQLSRAELKLSQLETLTETLDELRATQAKLTEDVQKQQHQLQHLEHTTLKLEADREHTQEQRKKLQQHVHEATRQLNSLLKPYELEVASDLSLISTELERRANQWQEWRRQHTELSQALESCQTSASHLQDKLADQQAELDKLEGRLGEKTAEISLWQRQKLAIWPHDDDMEAEFERLKRSAGAARQTWEAAHTALRTAETTHAHRRNQLAKMREQLHEFKQTHHEQVATVQQTWLQLRQHLEATGKLLAEPPTPSAEGLEPLMRWCDEHTTELTKLPPAALLSSSQAQLEQRMMALAEIKGGIRRQLDEHEQDYQRHCEHRTAWLNQQQEHQRWLSLSELIGHSKGTKYRNFAQGITLQRLISCANMQLHTMTDRYVLIQDSHDPLELSVRDQYQAGEIRSVKNLSGGESFLVSLALALGLSHLASHNTRVDSLFLDEGFGTLDEDTLEVAIDALSQLRRHDKMIGIISHVIGLKERIPAQIQVHKVPGGRSVLRGPGCARIAS